MGGEDGDASFPSEDEQLLTLMGLSPAERRPKAAPKSAPPASSPPPPPKPTCEVVREAKRSPGGSSSGGSGEDVAELINVDSPKVADSDKDAVETIGVGSIESEPSSSHKDMQSYADFREMLRLTPSDDPMPIALPDVEDKMAVVHGACLMMEVKRQQQQQQQQQAAPASPTVVRTHAGAEEDDLEGLATTTLAPGATRDITKSPKHHRLHMDNFVGEDAADDVSDMSEGEGEWVDVGDESTGPSPTPAQQQQRLQEQPPRQHGEQQQEQAETQEQEQEQGNDVVVAAATLESDAAANADADDGATPVAPFALDPDWDYDAPVKRHEKFSVARALLEGEYYDKLLEEAASPSRKPPEGVTRLPK